MSVHTCRYVLLCVCMGIGLRVSLGICEWMCWERACACVNMCVSPRVGTYASGRICVAVPLHHIYVSEEIFVPVCGHVLCACIDEPAIF